jgi:hypothetical protein
MALSMLGRKQHIDARANEGRCPFPALLTAYVAIIFVSAALMVAVPHVANVGIPLLGSLAATGFFGFVVEARRRRPNSCPWLDFGDARRAIMYLLLFIVGLSVVFPGVWPSRGVEWVFRVPFLLLVIAGLALLRIHKSVDHGDFEEAGVPRGIYFASRLPVHLLATLTVFVVIAAVLALLGVSR